jgi:hypothetical protein
MANVLKVHEQNTIEQLAALGWSRKRIARELGIDRKTGAAVFPRRGKIPPYFDPRRIEPASTPDTRPAVSHRGLGS